MAWIKRNLFFAVGGAVALVLMGCAGWYLFSQWSANNKSQAELEETYNQLEQVTKQNPSPGVAGGKVDNQKAAEDQIKQLTEINRQLKAHFVVIPSIPNSTNVSGREFATTLPGALANLTNAANAASVGLPPQFPFSFSAQIPLNTFAAGSLQPLSVQLGEVKAICDVLFASKINYLEAIRRERVSVDDENGGSVDYLNEKSKVTDLAIVSPYEVVFECFGGELAGVLAGFSNSKYCIGVHSITVQPATERALNYGGGYGGTGTDMPRTTDGGGGYGGYGGAPYGANPNVPNPAGVVGTTRTGPVTFLDEKKIRVTLRLEVVKLKSKA